MELTRKISFELDRMFSCGSATKHKLTRKLSAYQAHEKNIDQASIDSSICGEIILNENINAHETLVPPPLPLDPNPDQNPVQPSEKSNRRSKTPQKIEIVRSYSSMIDKNRRCSREKSSSPTKSSNKSNKSNASNRSPINQRKSLHQRSNNNNDPPEPVYDEINQNAHHNNNHHHKTLRHSQSSVRSEISSEKTGIREKTRVRIRVSKSKSRERDSQSSTRRKLSIRGPTSQNDNDGQHNNNDNSSHQKVQPRLSNEIFNLADRDRSDPRRRSLRRRKSKNPLSLSNSVSDNHILPNGQLSASKPIFNNSNNNDNNNNNPEKRMIPNYYTTTTCTSEQDSNANDSTSYSHIDNKQNQSKQTNHLIRKPSVQETIDMVEKLELTSSKLMESYENKNSTYSSHNSKSKQKLKIKVSGKLKTNYSTLAADNESSQVLDMNGKEMKSSVNFKNYCDTAIYDNLNGHMRSDVSDSIKNSYSPTLEKLSNSNNQNKSNNIFNSNFNSSSIHNNNNNTKNNLTIREKIRSARELGQKNFARKNFDKIYNLANLPSLIRSGIINHQEIHGRTEDENCQNIGHDFSDGRFETALIDQWRRDFGVRAANKMYVTLQNTRYSLKELNSFRSGNGSF